MELVVAPDAVPRALALLPGSFNPPTRAHVDIARSALAFVDAVLFVLPRGFPHKQWEGASFAERLEMLRRVAAADRRLGVAVSEGGLYLEIGREARPLFPEAQIELLLGRDAAERIANWKYDEPGVFDQLLNEFPLRVAPRAGVFDRAHQLEVPPDCETISATEVRRRIREGESWEHLVPPEIADLAARIYA